MAPALEQRPPESPRDEPKGPERQLLSVDGAMVPLVGGRWAEVKTLVLGTIGEPRLRDGELEVHSSELSYFSRMADHDSFGRLATVETYRRGTTTADLVCAVNDGAEWEQGFVDLQRPDAVRVLDFGHSSEHLAEVSQAVFGRETAEAKDWLSQERHELRHGDSEKVLCNLRRLRDELAGVEERAEALGVVESNLEYFEKRREQIRYREFEAKGLPIGSGAVESANKLLVEARLKGSGMHWADEHVNPMVALRTVACSDRWEEAWPEIEARLREQVRERASARRARRRAAMAKVQEALVVAQAALGAEASVERPPTIEPVKAKPSIEQSAEEPGEQGECRVVIEKVGPRRPAANHPWRHMPIGRARQR